MTVTYIEVPVLAFSLVNPRENEIYKHWLKTGLIVKDPNPAY